MHGMLLLLHRILLHGLLLHRLHGLHGLHWLLLHGLHRLLLHVLLIDGWEHRLLLLAHTHIVVTSEGWHWHAFCTNSAWHYWNLALNGVAGLSLVTTWLHHHLRHAWLLNMLLHELTVSIIGVIHSWHLLLRHLHRIHNSLHAIGTLHGIWVHWVLHQAVTRRVNINWIGACRS